MINDITTSQTEPPAFVEIKKQNPTRDMEYPKEFWEEQQRKHPEIVPLETQYSVRQAFDIAVNASKNMARWDIVAQDLQAFRIEATSVTKFLRFKDDVVIEIRPSPNSSEKSIVHMRSKSRLGRNDFGANAARISSFFAQFKAEETSQSGK